MASTEVKIPEAFQLDIERAVKILKDGGCAEVFLFGSLVEGKGNEKSDIDLAVRGCPKGEFFSLLGKLIWELEHPVDLITLDRIDPFTEYLQKQGELFRIG